MGYETHFRLKGELDEQFKPFVKKPFPKAELAKNKKTLWAAIMLSPKKFFDEKEFPDTMNISKIYSLIDFLVRGYIMMLSQNWKYGLEKELKENGKETFFCGWQYSDSRGSNSSWDDEDDLCQFFTGSLFDSIVYYACHQYGNGKEDEENIDYDTNIRETIDELDDSVSEFWNHKFIERYRDNADADEDDGNMRQFPENVENTEQEDNGNSED